MRLILLDFPSCWQINEQRNKHWNHKSTAAPSWQEKHSQLPRHLPRIGRTSNWVGAISRKSKILLQLGHCSSPPAGRERFEICSSRADVHSQNIVQIVSSGFMILKDKGFQMKGYERVLSHCSSLMFNSKDELFFKSLMSTMFIYKHVYNWNTTFHVELQFSFTLIPI